MTPTLWLVFWGVAAGPIVLWVVPWVIGVVLLFFASIAHHIYLIKMPPEERRHYDGSTPSADAYAAEILQRSKAMRALGRVQQVAPISADHARMEEESAKKRDRDTVSSK
jgi:hypothetical protein